MRVIINFIAFQIGWFAAVLGPASGMPWLGIAVVPFVLGLHLAMAPNWRPELTLALAAAVMGFIFDTVLTASSVLSPVYYLLPPPFSPPWMVMLWINFSITLNVSLRSLRGRYALAALLGAIGGPAAYYAGQRLGAVEIHDPESIALLVLAAAWAGAVPLLFRLAAYFNKRYGVRTS